VLLGRALNVAPKTPQLDVAKFMVSGSININEASKAGYTLLHGQDEVTLTAFLVANGADVNVTDTGGYDRGTPLHVSP
jgi:hypothetical protein